MFIPFQQWFFSWWFSTQPKNWENNKREYFTKNNAFSLIKTVTEEGKKKKKEKDFFFAKHNTGSCSEQ